MYRIYAEDTLIYDSTLDDFVISKGQIIKEVNKSGSFVFTVYPDHPYYYDLEKLKTVITVYKNDKIVFRGRILNESIGFFKDKTFTCEGELSFLLDSIQRPYSFTGTPEKLFKQYITNHNKEVENTKRFEIGDITVKDDNDYINRSNSNYDNTLTNIKDHLIATHEGYLHITRGENKQPILNWFEDFPYSSKQSINFGENLLDFVKTNSAESIATAIIPIGAKIPNESEEEKRLTIESVNGGLDYIYDPVAVEKYGKIFKVVTWDDVTEPDNLLRKGREYLNNVIKQNITIELKAIDLSLMDRSIDSFELGDYINIVSDPHSLNDKLLLKKQTIDLLTPTNDKITLGYTYSTFTDKSLSNNTQNETIVKRVEKIEKSYVDNTVVDSEIKTLRTLIDATNETIVNDYVATENFITELTAVLARATGISIGKTSEDPNLFDVGLPAKFRKNVVIESEWIDLEAVSSFKPYSGLNANKPKLKNIAGHVEIKGIMSPVRTLTSSATRAVMARGIPENLRPDTDRFFLCSGSNKATWECTVTTAGEITIAKYGTTGFEDILTSSILSFSVSYNI